VRNALTAYHSHGSRGVHPDKLQ